MRFILNGDGSFLFNLIDKVVLLPYNIKYKVKGEIKMDDELRNFIDKILNGWSILDPDLNCEAMIDTPEGRKLVAGIKIDYRLSQAKVQRKLLLIHEMENLSAEAAKLYEYWGEDTKNSRMYKRIIAEMKAKETELESIKKQKVDIDDELYEDLLKKEIKKLEIKSDYDKAIRMAKKRALEQVKQKLPSNEIKREFYRTVNAAEIRRMVATAQMEDEDLCKTIDKKDEITELERV